MDKYIINTIYAHLLLTTLLYSNHNNREILPGHCRLFSNSHYKVFNTFKSFLFKAFLNLIFSFSICSFSRFSSRICFSSKSIRFFNTISPMYLFGSIIPICRSSGQACPFYQFWNCDFFFLCQHLPDFCNCPVYFFFACLFIAGYHRVVFVHTLHPIHPDYLI